MGTDITVQEDRRQSVKRGIAWLDEHAKPGWREAIDLKTLDLESGSWCILGQLGRKDFLASAYEDESDAYTPVVEKYDLYFSQIELGFCRRFGGSWDALTAAWHAELSKTND